MSTENIDSLTLSNWVVHEFFIADLKTVHQLFIINRGRVTPASKDLDQVEDEFGIALTEFFRNRITRLTTLSRPNRNIVLKLENCLIQFMKRSKNNQHFTSLRLKDQRTTQQWGEGPRSYTTYLNDGIIDFQIRIFERNLEQLYKFKLSPGIRWILVQVFLRTLWIKVKQDWVAFMSQPYWVEVMVEVELRLKLSWGWLEPWFDLRLRLSFGWVWVEAEVAIDFWLGLSWGWDWV